MLKTADMPEQARAALERVTGGVLAQLENRQPRVVIFYNTHAPLEPMAEQAGILAGECDPDRVAFIEFPPGQTPLGYCNRVFDALQETAQELSAGDGAPAGVGPAAARKAGKALQGFLQHVTGKRSRDLAALLADIPCRSMGEATGPLHVFFKECEDETGLTLIRKKGEIIRQIVDRLGPRWEEEHLIAALPDRFADTCFVSMHAHFFMPAVAAEHGFPLHELRSTRLDHTCMESLPSTDRWWFFKLRYEPPPAFLDAAAFSESVSYTAFELFLPVHYLWGAAAWLEKSSPDTRGTVRRGQVLRAATARYLLEERESRLLYDYFLPVEIDPEHGWVEEHVSAIHSYLRWRHGIERPGRGPQGDAA